MKNERWKRDADYINVTTIYIHLFGCVCLKTGTGGRDSRDPTLDSSLSTPLGRNGVSLCQESADMRPLRGDM
jgi:hypothetical protein